MEIYDLELNLNINGWHIKPAKQASYTFFREGKDGAAQQQSTPSQVKAVTSHVSSVFFLRRIHNGLLNVFDLESLT